MNSIGWRSCDRAPDLEPFATRFAPLASQAQMSQPAAGCCMPASHFRSTPALGSQAFVTNGFCVEADEIGTLNIPSIYETIRENGFTDEPKTLEWNWPSDELEGAGNEAGKYDDDEEEDCEHSTEVGENITNVPLKRLRRQRANDRERRRMKSLNGALNNLKRCIPLPKTKRRVTKLEILRIACNYIQSLWDTLNNGDIEGHNESSFGKANNPQHIVNGMSVTQRLSLLSSNMKFNFQL